MGLTDILLLVAIVGYCGYIIFFPKKRGCCGDCTKCQGCGCKKK